MSSADIESREVEPGDEDPFRFGWREDNVRLSDGSWTIVQTPLTMEDLLYPQENYKIANNSQHKNDCKYMDNVLQCKFRETKGVLVLADQPVYWGRTDFTHHSPDIAVIFDVQEEREVWTSFHVVEQKRKPKVLVEVVSVEYRDNDLVTKVEQYHLVGIEWYVIVDRIQTGGPPSFIVLQWQPQGYVERQPEADGKFFIEPLGVKIGVKGNRVALYDAATGEELGDYVEVWEDRDAAREDARLEREARLKAEKGQKEADEARLKAEKGQKEADEARLKAEKDKQQEHEARLKAEKDAQELSEQLAALQKLVKSLQPPTSPDAASPTNQTP